jgi:hypothetical protein
MRIIGIVILALLTSVGFAKNVHIRANIVQQCGAKPEASASSAPIGPTLNHQIRFDCAQKTAWAKMSKQDELQWQRISIDY